MAENCIALNKSGNRCRSAGDVSLLQARGRLCPLHFSMLEERGELATVEGLLHWPAAESAGAGAPPSPPPPAEEAAGLADIPTFRLEDEPAAAPPPPPAAWDIPDVPEPAAGDPPSPLPESEPDPHADFQFADLDGGPQLGTFPTPAGGWNKQARLAWQAVNGLIRRAGATPLDPGELDTMGEAWGPVLGHVMRNADPNNPFGAAVLTTALVLLPRAVEVRQARAAALRERAEPAEPAASVDIAGPPPPATGARAAFLSQLA